MSVWLSPTEILALPASGAAFTAVKAAADSSLGTAKVSDQDSQHDVRTLACALVAVRQGSPTSRAKAEAALRSVIGTEAGTRALALGRNLGAYACAADILGFREPAFVTWLGKMRTFPCTGGPGTLIKCHEQRGNNWGVMAGWSRVAIDAYLEDTADLAKAAQVWKGWFGDRTAYAGFAWGDKSWQADPLKPVGVNPAGALKQGHPISGVLPDDQRRTGGFTWPPPCGNYVRGALGPVFCALWTLHRNGFADASGWSSSAARRAAEWYVGTMGGKTACAFSGDDAWQPYLIRKLYPGIAVTGGSVSAVGKPMAWTGWTHA